MPYDIRCSIREQGCNCLALVDNESSPFCILLFSILPRNNYDIRDCLNVYRSSGSLVVEDSTGSLNESDYVEVGMGSWCILEMLEYTGVKRIQ